MFFRRKKLQIASFSQGVQLLEQNGFQVQSDNGGKRLVTKNGCGIWLEDGGVGHPKLDRAGVLVNGEIGMLVNGGYQMFLLTPTGKRRPAQAAQLHALHEFQEDLKEALGMTSLYNESLGTISSRHMYDRVEDRDEGVTRVWETHGDASKPEAIAHEEYKEFPGNHGELTKK